MAHPHLSTPLHTSPHPSTPLHTSPQTNKLNLSHSRPSATRDGPPHVRRTVDNTRPTFSTPFHTPYLARLGEGWWGGGGEGETGATCTHMDHIEGVRVRGQTPSNDHTPGCVVMVLTPFNSQLLLGVFRLVSRCTIIWWCDDLRATVTPELYQWESCSPGRSNQAEQVCGVD